MKRAIFLLLTLFVISACSNGSVDVAIVKDTKGNVDPLDDDQYLGLEATLQPVSRAIVRQVPEGSDDLLRIPEDRVAGQACSGWRLRSHE